MALFFAAFVLLCLCSVRVFPGKAWNTEYLSIEQTQTVKGIFIILVFFSHFHSYVSFTAQMDIAYRNIVSWFGQTMVTMFLLYSGYGVMESIKRKGQGYIEAIPRRRFLSTLFRFDCAVLLFGILALWKGESITLKRFALSLIGWDSLGNSNWYIFCILVLYLITYGAFKTCQDHSKAVTLSFLLVCAGVFCLAYWNIKDMYWYDTALCYVLGMLYSRYKEKAERYLNASRLGYLAVLILLTGASAYLRQYEYEVLGSILRNCAFALAVLVLTMRISFRSKILRWCGTHLFSLYILQRIPMILMKYFGLADRSIVLYFLCSVAGTLLLMFPFDYVTNKLWNKLQEKT